MEFSRFVAALAPASALVDPEMLRSSFNRLDVGGPMEDYLGDPQRTIGCQTKMVQTIFDDRPELPQL